MVNACIGEFFALSDFLMGVHVKMYVFNGHSQHFSYTRNLFGIFGIFLFLAFSWSFIVVFAFLFLAVLLFSFFSWFCVFLHFLDIFILFSFLYYFETM